jgi:hypothetical protein
MSSMQAWKFIIDNLSSAKWIPIPEEVKGVLHLDSRVGLYNGMLVSKQGSQGMEEFIKRMNSKKG